MAAFFAQPVVISITSGVVVALLIALANYAVRQIGKGSQVQPRLASLETHQADEMQFRRTMLTVTGHQTAALTVLLEVTKGRKVNGNVDAALERMKSAEKETDEYLVGVASGGREKS
jgi:hypothetical protein